MKYLLSPNKQMDAKEKYAGFINVDEAMEVNSAEDAKRVTELQLAHLNQYRTQDAIDIGAAAVAVKAEGCHFWDAEGNKHLDFIGSVGPGLLGLNNPFVIETVAGIYACPVQRRGSGGRRTEEGRCHRLHRRAHSGRGRHCGAG